MISLNARQKTTSLRADIPDDVNGHIWRDRIRQSARCGYGCQAGQQTSPIHVFT
jgi:hypothetical protein